MLQEEEISNVLLLNKDSYYLKGVNPEKECSSNIYNSVNIKEFEEEWELISYNDNNEILKELKQMNVYNVNLKFLD